MAVMTFERYEKKYLLTPAQHRELCRALANSFALDQYGRHTIYSVYYDTPDYALIRASLQKPRYKEKLRLRSYGAPQGDSTVFLELKKKVNGIVYKRRIPLTMDRARAWDRGQTLGPEFGQIGKEIEWVCTRYPLAPKALILCEREALYGLQNADLRITFDYNIRFRTQNLDPAQGSGGTLLRPGLILMEVKIPGALPLPMARLFSELDIQPVSFSKYGTAYAEHIFPEQTADEFGVKKHA